MKWRRTTTVLLLIALSCLITVSIIWSETEGRTDSDALERKLPMGPLRISSINPRYFTDDSGRAIYLTGSHTWNNFQDMGVGRLESFDYAAYLNFLRRYNHNFFRLWVWEQVAWFSPIPGKMLFSPMPFQRTGPGTLRRSQ